jgi:hypothetical protein
VHSGLHFQLDFEHVDFSEESSHINFTLVAGLDCRHGLNLFFKSFYIMRVLKDILLVALGHSSIFFAFCDQVFDLFFKYLYPRNSGVGFIFASKPGVELI